MRTGKSLGVLFASMPVKVCELCAAIIFIVVHGCGFYGRHFGNFNLGFISDYSSMKLSGCAAEF